MKRHGMVLWCALAVCCGARAEIHKFQVEQPGVRNLGVWRLTHDPTVRDSGSYHNIQCWSHNGRYTCYTHWVGTRGPGGKASAEVHVIDLATGRDIRVDNGYNPRWALGHNWLVYCHRTENGEPAYETGTQLIRFDADTGEKVILTNGVENPTGFDEGDEWVYGTKWYRGRKPRYTTVRVRNREDGEVQILHGAPDTHAYIHVNPRHPVLMTRMRDPKKPVYGSGRVFFDVDGGHVRIAAIMAEICHMSWSADGEYLLLGNGQARGRPWDRPYPSDLEIFSWHHASDICQSDRSGRYITTGNHVAVVDTRSGDGWMALYTYSRILFPMKGDHSTIYDCDPKGSPDGTKVHFHGNLDIENLVGTMVTGYDKGSDILHVQSTEGFPEQGDVAFLGEVIGYGKKTAKTFGQLAHGKYGTPRAPGYKSTPGRLVIPLSEFLLTDKQREGADPLIHILMAGRPKDHPLLYQRQTDCYIVVIRRPFQPFLRVRDAELELIPGEMSRETRGYRLLKDGRAISDKLLQPGQTVTVNGPGRVTAVSVEWSGLASPPSKAVEIGEDRTVRILSEAPADFSWTERVWKVGGKRVEPAQARAAEDAVCEVDHLYDGVIARETWHNGARIERVDLNEDGKPIRFQEFADGTLRRRVYRDPQGALASEELYAADGYKTEYVRYYLDGGRAGRVSDHWWYDHGKPIKRERYGGRAVFDSTKSTDKGQ